MKIACDSCGAKYTIADEKVAGKTVKIRCKKCGATMVIDGRAAGGSSASASLPPLAIAEAAGWMLHTGEGDQETASLSQIVERYRDGRIDGRWQTRFVRLRVRPPRPGPVPERNVLFSRGRLRRDRQARRVHRRPRSLRPLPRPGLRMRWN